MPDKEEKIRFLFNRKKAAGAAAAILSLMGGALPIERIQALMYIADRTHLERCAAPITTETWYRGGGCPVAGRNIVRMFEDGWFRMLGDGDTPVTVILNGHHDFFYYLSYIEAETILDIVWKERGKQLPVYDPENPEKKGDAVNAVLSLPELQGKEQCEEIPFEEIAAIIRPKDYFTDDEWLDELRMTAFAYNSHVKPIGSGE